MQLLQKNKQTVMYSLLHDTFLRAVDGLELKFPLKKICEKTGYGKGVVSEYLNSKKEVSESFAKTFCDKYEFSFSALKSGSIVKLPSTNVKGPQEFVQAATIKMLFERVAQIEAMVSGRESSLVVAEMLASTSSILEGMIQGKG